MKKFRILRFKSKPILNARGISKSFNKRMVLRKIDIQLNKGEMCGLLGSNGAGKSTFFHILLGIVKGDHGDIFLNGVNINSLPIHERSKLGISYLPQQTSIFKGLTVYENLLGIAQIIKNKYHVLVNSGIPMINKENVYEISNLSSIIFCFI